MISQACIYCGSLPYRTKGKDFASGGFVCNGIDRVDNSKGYVKGNLVPCCDICNKAKHNRSVLEFETWMNNLIRFRSNCVHTTS